MSRTFKFRAIVPLTRLFAITLSLAAVTTCPATADPTNRRAVAVIMGNSNYQGSTPTVDYAHNDADSFKAFVIGVLGYDPDNIIDIRDATKAQMETAFGNERSNEGKLWRYLDPKGRSDVVVFYSGHGVPGLKDKRGYLLPVDADANAQEINGFPLDVLLENLGQLKTKSLSVFLDACFSGDSPKGMLIRATSGISVTPKMPKTNSAMTLITAAEGDQVASWDVKAKHGMFTKHLLDALYGKADGPDYGNNDGKIALGEVKEYLDDRMTRAARRQFGRHQNASVRGNDNKLLVSGLPANVKQAEIKTAAVAPQPAPVVKKPAAVIKKPEPVVKAYVPPPKPAFNTATLERHSTWRIEVDFTDIYGADFSAEITMVNGRIGEPLYNGHLILDLWGNMRRGVLELKGTVADRERFVHAPWGPAVEMIPHTFDTLVDVKSPNVHINTTAGADFTGDTSGVTITLTLLRSS